MRKLNKNIGKLVSHKDSEDCLCVFFQCQRTRSENLLLFGYILHQRFLSGSTPALIRGKNCGEKYYIPTVDLFTDILHFLVTTSLH